MTIVGSYYFCLNNHVSKRSSGVKRQYFKSTGKRLLQELRIRTAQFLSQFIVTIQKRVK